MTFGRATFGADVTFERYVQRPGIIAHFRSSDFAAELDALVEYLEVRGHRRTTIHAYVFGAAHLAYCIEDRLIRLKGLSPETLRSFARLHVKECRCPCSRRASPHLISVAPHFYEILRRRGHCARPRRVRRRSSRIDRLLQEFDRHLRGTRGLAPSSRERSLRELRPLLVRKYGTGPVDPASITADDVRHWVAARARTTSARTAQVTGVAIRRLVRFFVLRGHGVAHLEAAVPMVRTHRHSTVPGGLSDEQLARLLGSIDVTRPTGLRARAIIECAASLGMRAGEIAHLRLRDVDWRLGVIHLPRTKVRRAQTLPLVRAVGRALASYLRRGRPITSSDRIFVRHAFPVGGALKSKDISATVRSTMARAALQLPSMGAHALRHTIACRLARAGAGMKNIADIMRHRDLDTTYLYAKVDWPRLEEVALPWPTASAS